MSNCHLRGKNVFYSISNETPCTPRWRDQIFTSLEPLAPGFFYQAQLCRKGRNGNFRPHTHSFLSQSFYYSLRWNITLRLHKIREARDETKIPLLAPAELVNSLFPLYLQMGKVEEGGTDDPSYFVF